MKKVIFAIAAVALTASLGMAQPGGGQRSPEERQRMMQERYAKRDADLRKVLELSDELAAKVDSVNHSYDKQQAEIVRGGDRDAMRSKMEAIQNSRTAGVKALLSEEQAKKYDQWLEQERAESAARRGNRGGGRP
jgi:Spy/CpxP family protein refolding chaperone